MHGDRPGQSRTTTATRDRILALLRRAQHTVGQLASHLGLTGNAVRAQLLALERDGLVQQAGRLRGVRKPHVVYELTPHAAEHLFPKAYAPVLNQLLTVLGQELTPEQREQVLRAVGARLAAPHQPAFHTRSPEQRLQAAVELLGKMGGLAELEQRDGRRFIRGYSCPLSAVVPDHPDACRVAESLLSQLLGTPVRECCQKGEQPRCCFEVL